MVERDAQATSRCGTSPRCTTSTAAGAGSSTSTTATGWRSPRPGPRRRSRWRRFVRPDELHQAFNFAWLLRRWSAAAFAEVISGTLAAVDAGRRRPDLGAEQPRRRRATRPATAAARSALARARAATLAMLALPGSAYLYQGEELGLEQVDVAPEHRQDPSWFRTGEVGRDGCRVPIPWGGDAPPFGFGPGAAQPWIPQPDDWAGLTVEAQTGDRGLDAGVLPRGAGRPPHARATAPATRSTCRRAAATCWPYAAATSPCVLNCGTTPGAAARRARCSSAAARSRRLPPDTAVWLAS